MGLLKAKRNGQMVAYRLDKAAVILGSGEACNIKVADAGLVARHCQILKMENGYVLRDMSGDAGTFVNGKKVKEHLLVDRDIIQVGKERFTFSESEGENTARVAVSVAPAAATPAAKTGATTRATVPPARSGNTGRIAAPAPAAEPSGRSTQRVNKAATQRTATVQKSTGRIEGGTKKITARTAAGMGYQTSKTTFAMPSTKKGKFIAIGGVLFILAIGGGLYGIKSGQVNPDRVREDMNNELKAVQKLKPDQIIEIDNGLEEILNKHADVKNYVLQRYSEIEREHKKVHQIAMDLKKAMKEVQPFFTKYEAASKLKPDELKAQAQALYDECKSLTDSHGGTTLGDKLRTIQDQLMKMLADRGPSWTQEYPALQRETEKLMVKGDYAGSLKAANAFGTTYKEKEELELFKKLDDMRTTIGRRADASPKKLIDAAKKLLEDKKKDDAVKLLEEAKAGLEGFPKALEKIDAELQAIKK